MTSIASSLGIGSGLDINALVTSLANAAKEPKEALLVKREQANQAKVSTLAQISNGIDGFASALSTLISGGTLYSQPSVSDPSVFTASALAGSRLGGLSSQIEVQQLAQAKTMVSDYIPDPNAVGSGTLTITVGANSFDVVIAPGADTLANVAKAINDGNTGVTASVVTDTAGSRLVLKGKMGAANDFTVSGIAFADDMTETMRAQNAELKLDGVLVSRTSNSFSDLIPGVQIDLKNARPGSLVSIGVTRPTAAIGQAVQDFVAAYNELRAMMAEATKAGVDGDGGVLRGDIGVRTLERELAKLPTMALSSVGDGPHTLAEIGVRTNRDGTLGVDTARLQAVLASDPDGVEALFNPGQYSSSPFLTIKSAVGKVAPGTYTITDVTASPTAGKVDGKAMTPVGTNLVSPSGSSALGLILAVSGNVASATITIDPGLGGALKTIRDALRARDGAFANAQERFAKEAGKIAEDREALETRSETYYNQLLTSFTAMDRQVSAFKATQSYLDQQIKMWTGGND